MAAAICVAIAFYVMLAGKAHSAEFKPGAYISAFGGVQFMSDPELELLSLIQFEGDADTGYRIGAAVGYRFSEMLRAEIEGSIGQNEVTVFGFDANVTTAAVMLNGYVDFDIGFVAVPYVGIGFGGALVADDVIDRENLVPAGQAMIGLTIPLNDNLSARAGYRYFRTFGGQLGPIDIPEGLSNHILEAGLIWNF